MLTAKKLQTILNELVQLEELGCTYDFKERHLVGLESLEALGFVKVIKSRIPQCGDHCEQYNDCKWIPYFESRKSAAKYKLTKDGLAFVDILRDDLSENELEKIIQKEISTKPFIDLILAQFIEVPEISVEELVNLLLTETNIGLDSIRTTLKDILDLMESVKLLKFAQGVLVPFV